ncbi:MAG: hypothetical protein ACRDXX_07370 [Stackebrandtia sp.]
MSEPNPRTSDPDAADLGCYTAAVAGYLAGECADVTERLARSVRLAVAVDGDGELAFSHHRHSLADLPDGGRLAYAAAPTAAEAMDGIGAELTRHGRVIVVGNTVALPWSPAYDRADDAHWTLVDDRRPGQWHIVDHFVALLPDGEHRPHSGWLSDAELAAALTPRRTPTTAQRNRDRYAFGVAVETPSPQQHWWIRRSTEAASTTPDPSWEDGRAGLETLERRLLDDREIAQYSPDVWAAARHRLYQLRWLAGRRRDSRVAVDETTLDEATQAWRSLPMTMRFAVESTRRGRPRTQQLRHTLQTLIRLETERPLDSAMEVCHDG